MALLLNEKVKVTEAKEKDKLSVWEIMMWIKCGKMHVYNALTQKDQIMNEWVQGNGRVKRKAKVTSNEEINEVMWECFTNARSKNIHMDSCYLHIPIALQTISDAIFGFECRRSRTITH
jgi:hypothetical protein